MDEPPKPPKPPNLRFGEPEKTDWKKVALMCVFIALGIFAIVWLASKSPKQPTLTCSGPSGNGLWSSFGRCAPN